MIGIPEDKSVIIITLLFSLLLFLHLPSQATFWLMEGILDSYV
jgi:hypothetical protein